METVTNVAASSSCQIVAAAGDHPGGQREEESEQLGHGVRKAREHQRARRRADLAGERGGLAAQDVSLGSEPEQRWRTRRTRSRADPAFSWIRFENPLRWEADSGSELPAMKPATHASAWRARTSALRNRTCR